MSAYTNFVQDFPNRCREVLKLAEKRAQVERREVTLALVVASAGILVPYERLKPDGEIAHPSGNNTTFPDAAQQFRCLLKRPFLSSPIWGQSSLTWHCGKLEPNSMKDDPDSWEGLRNQRYLGKDRTVGGVLRVIRNALAHGGIWTFQDPIETIIFTNANYRTDKKTVKDHSFISVGPEDFRQFLEKWFTFLEHLNIPQKTTLDSGEDN